MNMDAHMSEHNLTTQSSFQQLCFTTEKFFLIIRGLLTPLKDSFYWKEKWQLLGF